VVLDKHLGAWYDADRHIEYDAYRSKNVICKRQQIQGASIYDKYIEDGKSIFFIQDGIRYQPTHKSHPIEITQHGDRIQACNPYFIAIDQERKSRENGDEEEEETEEAGLQILLSEEKLVACSDGSFDPIDCKAAFNWRIVTPDERGLITASAPVNTNPQYLNAYRAEFAGLQSLIRYLRKRNVHLHDIEIHCDNQASVDILNKGPNEGSLTALEKAKSDII
jgi:hypothetical protein